MSGVLLSRYIQSWKRIYRMSELAEAAEEILLRKKEERINEDLQKICLQPLI